MNQSMIVTPVSVVNHIMNNIQMGYPEVQALGWEEMKSFTEFITESNLGGADVDVDVSGEHSCHTGLHSDCIFAQVRCESSWWKKM